MAAPVPVLVPFVLAGAILYTSVGHGGATVYLAILTLAGYATAPLVTTVLALNILAAGIAFATFRHAGYMRTGLLLPFLLTSVPMAYLGGRAPLSLRAQELVLAVALLAAAARFLLVSRPPDLKAPRNGAAFWALALALGALLGFLAGATGIGGGIFLSPILVMLGWADVREAGAVASAFIVINSVAGLAARLPRTPFEPSLLVPLAATVLVGALLGAHLGARRLPPRALQLLLAVVLVVAAAKALV